MGVVDNPDTGDPSVSVEDPILGVVSWWLGKYSRNEVLVLITRHFKIEEVFEAHKLLATKCKLPEPTGHRNSVLRSAGEASAVDLINTIEVLRSEKKAPKFVIASDNLGKFHLEHSV